MNHTEALIELATLVGQLKQATEAYESSSINNAQVRYEALCKIQERIFAKSEALLANSGQPARHPFHAFQAQLKGWADVYFGPTSGRIGTPVTLDEAVVDFRQTYKACTIHVFLRCLKYWAEESGLPFDYSTKRVNRFVRRVIIISPNPSNN